MFLPEYTMIISKRLVTLIYILGIEMFYIIIKFCILTIADVDVMGTLLYALQSEESFPRDQFLGKSIRVKLLPSDVFVSKLYIHK